MFKLTKGKWLKDGTCMVHDAQTCTMPQRLCWSALWQIMVHGYMFLSIFATLSASTANTALYQADTVPYQPIPVTGQTNTKAY